MCISDFKHLYIICRLRLLSCRYAIVRANPRLIIGCQIDHKPIGDQLNWGSYGSRKQNVRQNILKNPRRSITKIKVNADFCKLMVHCCNYWSFLCAQQYRLVLYWPQPPCSVDDAATVLKRSKTCLVFLFKRVKLYREIYAIGIS